MYQTNSSRLSSNLLLAQLALLSTSVNFVILSEAVCVFCKLRSRRTPRISTHQSRLGHFQPRNPSSPRCRLASYNSNDPATAAFKLSTAPGQGIVTFSSHISSH